MTVLTHTASGIALLLALLALLTLWPGASRADRHGSPVLREEISKQENIYRSKGPEVDEGYTVDRTLSDYIRALTFDFATVLENLGPKDRWLDIGAGRGNAILDYLSPDYELNYVQGFGRRSGKAQAVAMSIEDRRTIRWHLSAEKLGEGKLRYLFDRRLREYSLQELGKFQVITDVIGGFSYTEDLTQFMDKVLGFLELKGTFFTLLQDVRSEDGGNLPHYKGEGFLTEIKNAKGSEVKVCSWLKSISCVEVSCEHKPTWTPPVESYRVRKVCSDIRVPALLTDQYRAGTPPERRFTLKTPPPPAPPGGPGAKP